MTAAEPPEHPPRPIAEPPAPTPGQRAPVQPLPPPLGQTPLSVRVPESPGTGSAAPVRRPRWARVLFWGGITVMVAAALFGLADWAARTYELNTLLDRVERSEAAMKRYQDEASAVDVPEDPTQAERQQAAQELETVAARNQTAVVVAGDQVAQVPFLPWHGELVSAQESYLAHNRAWADHLERGSQDVTVLLGEDALINSTWATAEVVVRRAEPWPTLPTIRSRVDAIFAPAPDDDAGSDPGLSV